ncbi:MAG: hypothetical protein ACSLFD_01230 [Solirubrobacterales bacterium]
MTKSGKKDLIAGETKQGESPHWDPLLNLVGERTPEFMWMFEIELEDGTAVHAYKHSGTRRYFHLGVDGRTFIYRHGGVVDGCPGMYEQVPFLRVAADVFWGFDPETGKLDDPGDRQPCFCYLRCYG